MKTLFLTILMALALISCSDTRETGKSGVFVKSESGWRYHWSEQCPPIPVSKMFLEVDDPSELEKTLNRMSRDLSVKKLPACQVWLEHAKRITRSDVIIRPSKSGTIRPGTETQ